MVRRLSLSLVVTTSVLLALSGQAAAKPPAKSTGGYTLVQSAPGSASLVTPGNNSATAVQLTSTGTGWGAIGFNVPRGLKLRDVNSLSTDYEFVLGSCWGGAPRFTIGVTNKTTKEMYFYLGPPPSWTGCVAGVWGNTGNLASPGSPVDDSQLPQGSYSEPYSQAQARYGSYTVAYIAIDLDGGWDGAQTVDFDNTQVNGALYTYES